MPKAKKKTSKKKVSRKKKPEWEPLPHPAVKDVPVHVPKRPPDDRRFPVARYPCWIPDCPDPWYGPLLGKARPKRYRGEPMGKPGWLCGTCYQCLYHRERRAEARVKGRKVRVSRPSFRRPM